jgi:hypothetical protein
VSHHPLLQGVGLTLDVDWAPDCVIDHVAAELRRSGVPATWFVTHAAAAVERLRETPALFELGIHPNFLPGSSHGATVREVLSHCMRLVPEARSMRTHSLVQSSPLLGQVVRETPITVDVSLLLPRHQGLQPVQMPLAGRTLLRLPFYWEDDIEMAFATPDWTPLRAEHGGSLRILNFHPIHIYLNSTTMGAYQALKAAVPDLQAATPAQLTPFREQGQGTGWAFRQLVHQLARSGEAARVGDLADRWLGQEDSCC